MAKVFYFHVTLCGTGNTPDEAWENCVEGFCQDPGPTPDEHEFETEEIPDGDM